MATHTLHEWLADPLFAAAEDVQESADRLESNFRTWKQETSDPGSGSDIAECLRLRLVSACDTLKWQLEVFERAVASQGSQQGNWSLNGSAVRRRQEFVDIIRLQLCAIEAQLRGPSPADFHPTSSAPLRHIAKGPSFAERTLQQELLTGACSTGLLLPGEFYSQRTRAGSQIPHYCSTSLSSLSGFLGVSTPRPLAESGNVGIWSPQSASALELRTFSTGNCSPGVMHQGGEDCTGAKDPNCSVDVPVMCEEVTQECDAAHLSGSVSPGPECKSFPSLAHLGGAQHGVHGWQCIFLWMQHFQRMSRRRLLESSKSSEGNLTSAPKSVVAVSSSRMDVGQASSVSRTSSAVNLNVMDQSKRGEWHMDVPSTTTPHPVEEQSTIPSSSWHLTARPRRLNTMQRPGRGMSSLILVCAAAVLMIAATVFSQYGGAQVFEQRRASLLAMPTSQASSPAFP